MRLEHVRRNGVAYLALFVALGGTSVGATTTRKQSGVSDYTFFMKCNGPTTSISLGGEWKISPTSADVSIARNEGGANAWWLEAVNHSDQSVLVRANIVCSRPAS